MGMQLNTILKSKYSMAMLTLAMMVTVSGETSAWLKCKILKLRGLGMERDIHFTPQKIGNVSGLQDRFKTSPDPEVKGTFGEDVPIDEALKEKKAAER